MNRKPRIVPDRELMTQVDVARILGVTTSHVRNLIASGEIAVVSIPGRLKPRVARSEVENILAKWQSRAPRALVKPAPIRAL